MAPVERWTRFSLRECGHCDLRIWDPPEVASATWYDASDHYLANPIVDWLGWYHRWALARIPPSSRRLLDIGCGDGRFVYAAARRGIDARGIDHSRRLVELGNERFGGDRLSVRSIDELRDRGQTFDVVTLFEVIEHVATPLALLETASGLLAPGGTLIVSTPNRLGRPHPPAALDRPPHHVTRWTPAALSNALTTAGFQVRETGLSPGRIGLTAFIVGTVRLGLVRKLLRRRAAAGRLDPANSGDVRALIRWKERIADGFAWALDPFIGRAFSGGSMVVVATRAAAGPPNAPAGSA